MVSELSILIPIYNFAVDQLVNVLLAQCYEEAICFEIICLDDASESHFQEKNRFLKSLENVIYEELPTNISRAAIRNKLAQHAQFSHLLFLDNDSEIISQDFIRQYLQAGHPDKILIGGTLYPNELPSHPYRLHWKFGRSREQIPADFRNQHPYRSVQVNNALVPRAIFLNYPFNEKIIEYGHEDSQWGKRLEKAKVPVVHIANPVGHIGLEPCEIFLIKTRSAIHNLHRLYYSEGIGKDSSLIKWYLRLSHYKVKKVYFTFYRILKSILLFNLRSSRPSLFCFDLYKLGLFIQIDYLPKKDHPI
ncbi:glycosyltransferase family 2 protein [Adhaeribacter radiodurans]|uniref:Glycosyltransferase family 2 protein n=1 Tax=Adhaeribacter radiodurans TaxID=2745197 RepID=A0A7L7L841_9BACT|nr:glycosyltransferase family 2 protein [Adhaeribacter radiodurans]QMU28990.1 glycosyltransferase family 2 protein [Adhaeribacter radiodurans]